MSIVTSYADIGVMRVWQASVDKRTPRRTDGRGSYSSGLHPVRQEQRIPWDALLAARLRVLGVPVLGAAEAPQLDTPVLHEPAHLILTVRALAVGAPASDDDVAFAGVVDQNLPKKCVILPRRRTS